MYVRSLIVILFAFPLFAAGEMQRLDFMTGDWKGEATVSMGPGTPERVAQTERIRSKLGGEVLLIEGLGQRLHEDGTVGAVVHDALAVVSWDEAKKAYRFSTYVAGRGTGETTIELTGPRTAVWGMTTPQGRMRYTIDVSEAGEWVEVGEFSRDGQNWRKFIEMRLKKQ
jgi:hypothetical protein